MGRLHGNARDVAGLSCISHPTHARQSGTSSLLGRSSGWNVPVMRRGKLLDDQAAGGEWNVTSPQPQYWEGCPGGLSGGAGGLYLRPNDTANLSVGWHTLKIDYLGDSTYAPAEYTAQFLVIAAGQPWPSLSISGGQLEPGNPAYLEWVITNRGTGDTSVHTLCEILPRDSNAALL